MVETTKETKEVVNTAFVDKQLPTIEYSNKGMQSMTEGGEIYIKVSDHNIELALKVFKDILSNIYIDRVD